MGDPEASAVPAVDATPRDGQDNITDEEKQWRMNSMEQVSEATPVLSIQLQTIMESLSYSENDYEALFALSLFYAVGQNKGFDDILVKW